MEDPFILGNLVILQCLPEEPIIGRMVVFDWYYLYNINILQVKQLFNFKEGNIMWC